MSLKNKRILVTGGAGFIGSNLVEQLLNNGAFVRVLDNLATGNQKNLESFLNHPNFEFIEGDIRVFEDCQKAVQNIDCVSHQAALGSVPRSIDFPELTHEVNATGFLNMLRAVKEAGIKRFVYASSSSVYGDSTVSPKVIGSEGNLLSPYAVSKHINEEYAKVFHRLFGIETIGLRYFNVFGPNQDPNGVYAAAIPKFVDAMIKGTKIVINGDGEQSRDFTFVKNAVEANILGLSCENEVAFGNVYNVACNQSFTLNQVIAAIKEELIKQDKFNDAVEISYGPDRAGDIRNSLADISITKRDLNYTGSISFNEGISRYLNKL
ncbi:MAG TPA: SDR family oxidoreductase [Taishania sp.]|nr:SDR family oxidoreductase [Taishania sp.]